MAEAGSAYRERTRAENTSSDIALPAQQTGLGAVAITFAVVVLVTVVMVAAHNPRSTMLPELLAVLGGALVAPFALVLGIMGLIARNISKNRIVANAKGLEVRWTGKYGGRGDPIAIGWDELLAIEPQYDGPSNGQTALRVAAIATTGRYVQEQAPIPCLDFSTRSDSVRCCVSGFAARPEVIARRLARYERQREAGLRATNAEIEAQRARFTMPVILRGWFLSASRIVKLTREGLHVGWGDKSLKLHRWENVVSAHVIQSVGRLPGVIQVELDDGSVVSVTPRNGMVDDDVASLLAPRWFERRDDRERTILDLPADGTKRKKKKKRAKRKAEISSGA